MQPKPVAVATVLPRNKHRRLVPNWKKGALPGIDTTLPRRSNPERLGRTLNSLLESNSLPGGDGERGRDNEVGETRRGLNSFLPFLVVSVRSGCRLQIVLELRPSRTSAEQEPS
jgi:hypothetical protein